MIYFEQESNFQYIPGSSDFVVNIIRGKRKKIDGSWFYYPEGKEYFLEIFKKIFKNYYGEEIFPKYFYDDTNYHDYKVNKLNLEIHTLWWPNDIPNLNIKLIRDIAGFSTHVFNFGDGHVKSIYYRKHNIQKYILWKNSYDFINKKNFIGLVEGTKIINNEKIFKIMDHLNLSIDFSDSSNDHIWKFLLRKWIFSNYLQFKRLLKFNYFLNDSLELFISIIFKIFVKKVYHKSMAIKKKTYIPLFLSLHQDLNNLLDKYFNKDKKKIEFKKMVTNYKGYIHLYELLVYFPKFKINHHVNFKSLFKDEDIYNQLQKLIHPVEQKKLRELTLDLLEFLDYIKYSYCFIFDPEQYLTLPRGHKIINQSNGEIIHINLFEKLELDQNIYGFSKNKTRSPYSMFSYGGQKYHVLERILSYFPKIANLDILLKEGYISELRDPITPFRKKFGRNTINMAYIVYEMPRSYNLRYDQPYIPNGGLMNFVNWAIGEINK